jgi:large subunit ribosomal protein L10
MASEKILAAKQKVIDEIINQINETPNIVLFNYRGLTDELAKELRKDLKDNNANYKIYKNTFMIRAMNDLKIDINEHLVGPSAIAYSNDQIAAVKVLANFAKKHPVLELKVGIIDGNITDKESLFQLAALPSREGLLTMLAAGMIQIVKDLSICLNLYAEERENK